MKINNEKRKRIMSRSIKLGHCICDPKQPCPCPLFKEKNICMCAGERLDSPTGPVQLTKLIEKAGCASKIDQAFLKQVMKDLPEIDDPRVLVGVPAGDDAGIYDMGNGTALVQTVDVFTPCVDDPYTFGQVAAANSVSDIYAMGGRPMTALSVIGFPVRKIPDNAMAEILQGGIDKMNEAGVSIIGGHSINDPELKAGFAVTGIIDKNKVVTNDGARVGDVLILTKPLGTGMTCFAYQIGRDVEGGMEAAISSMTALNRTASELMVEYKANACTDVTGFGLMGHLTEMALRSGVDIEIIFDDIPLLPGVLEYAAAGILPGATERNKESCGDYVINDSNLAQDIVDICFDAQTSGGLLISISQKNARNLLKALRSEGVGDAAVIGKVLGKGRGLVHIKSTGSRKIPELKQAEKTVPVTQKAQKVSEMAESVNVPCCADAIESVSKGGGSSEIAGIKDKFKDFLSSAGSPHGLDAYTKQAMAIALSVAMRCEPCLKMHIKNAKDKGFTAGEIDEAAWMGISFAGSPAMVFYEQHKNS
jgi:selenide,water dikinase